MSGSIDAPERGGASKGLACARCGLPNEPDARFCLRCGAELRGTPPVSGRLLDGRYRIQREIGRGAFGRVVEAIDEQEGARVAIKLLNLPPAMPEVERKRLRASFHREWEAGSRLRHPLITRMIGTGSADGQPFLVMEYAAGQTLRERLEERGAPPLAEGMAIVADLLSALHHAHGLSIIHRDVKPSNVILGADGRARLTDFGIAKILETISTPRTQTGFLATPAYMSPEQASGARIDHRADLFSAGLVAYEVFTGRRPYSGNHPALIHQILTAPLPAAPEIPLPVMDWLQRACAKDPADRFATAAEMREALVAMAGTGSDLAAHAAITSPGPQASSATARTAPGSRRAAGRTRPAFAIAVALSAFVGAVILGSVVTWLITGNQMPAAPIAPPTHAAPVQTLATPTAPQPAAPLLVEVTAAPPTEPPTPKVTPTPTPSPIVVPTTTVAPPSTHAPAATPSPEPAPPPVDRARQLLLQMIDAMGGGDKIDAIRDFSYHLETKSHGLGFGKLVPDYDELWVLPDNLVLDLGRRRIVVTGLKAFKKELLGKQPLQPFELQAYRESFRHLPFLIAQRRDDPGLSVSLGKSEVTASGVGEVIEVELDGVATSLTIDPSTGRYLKRSFIGPGPNGPAREDWDYGDWTSITGVWVPLSWEIREENGPGFSAKLTNYKINSGIPLSKFD